MAKFIQNPHDKMFRKSMSDHRVARDVFEQGLSAEVRALIDFKSLHIEKDTFVDEQYRYELSDLVYRVKLKDGRVGYIYLLCEHLSQPRELMPFWLLSYQLKIMKAHLKKGHDKLPLVFPLVLYHGKSSYSTPTDLYACFEHPDLAEKYFLQPHGLIDLTVMADEDILKHKWASVMELIFKHVFERDVLPVFEKLAGEGIFQQLTKEGGSHYILDLVYYTIKTAEVSDPERFKKVFEHQDGIGEKVMTIFQQFEEQKQQIAMQNLQQGIEQGMEQQAMTIGRVMLERGMNESDVADITHLSPETIAKLKAMKDATAADD